MTYIGRVKGPSWLPSGSWYPVALKGIGNVQLTKLGNSVSGITFQYYKKGNILSVYVSGTLSTNISAWGIIKSTVSLPTSYRPLTTIYGTTSYPAADMIMGIGPDGYIYIQRASNTSGGNGNWFGFNASYGVDY